MPETVTANPRMFPIVLNPAGVPVQQRRKKGEDICTPRRNAKRRKSTNASIALAKIKPKSRRICPEVATYPDPALAEVLITTNRMIRPAMSRNPEVIQNTAR
jgi:hypothetical protein